MAEKIVECVPNISEGRDRAKIDAIVAAAAEVSGVRLLDVDPGAETNRTVITFVGPPEAVEEGAFRLIQRAAERIDMSVHRGAHARHGATDVCPFVPVSGVTMEECVAIARRLGERVGKELGIPVYLYGHAAQVEERRSLAVVRKGEYEALPGKLAERRWRPDFGPAEFLPRTGVATIGAREFLIAYNINLNTRRKDHAGDIAQELRETGRAVRLQPTTAFYSSGRLLRYRPGEKVWPSFTGEVFPSREALDRHYREHHGTSLDAELAFFGQDPERLEGAYVMKRGMFPECRAVGWLIPEYGRAQISINLTNPRVTNMDAVLEAARRLGQERGIAVTGSEIVGLVPHEALRSAGEGYLERQGSSRGIPDRDIVETAVQSLGLSDLKEFDVERSVIGAPSTAGPLTSLRVADFVDEVSRDSVAPGGGSISALAGSLAAALAAMVANITFGKGKYRRRRPKLEEIARAAQRVKDGLLCAVDRDTAAFQELMAAFRLPKATAEQRKTRTEAIQAATRGATEVPLASAELCLEALRLCRSAAERGLPAGITDAGVGALLARAALEGSLYNVQVNLASVKDREWARKIWAQVESLRLGSAALADETAKLVTDTFARSAE